MEKSIACLIVLNFIPLLRGRRVTGTMGLGVKREITVEKMAEREDFDGERNGEEKKSNREERESK